MSSAQQSPPQQRSLYRRHRPRRFADVVGRDAVVRTLRNAVQRGKVHHAYLFVGSRGTGKTSIAKILAACLNCERRGVGPDAGGAGAGGGGASAEEVVDACGVCESCIAIAEARSLDVIEMDAASNNSVEDIRELRESVAYAPLSGRSKVYILDEAHMLSTAAWNAFLKTLEEPPANTVFVLATTEAHKVPATVVDRCHRFDFHRPTVEQVATVLRRAADAESISIPPEAVAALARAADGSFRDALGTLEQLLTYSGEQIALQDVLAVLGVADAELIERTLHAVASGDARATLLAVEECVSGGRDPGALAADLEARARELIVVQVLGEVPPQLSLTPDADERLLQQSQEIGQPTLVRLLDLIAAALEATKAGGDARTQVELALLKAARPEVDPSTKALLARIERLEAGAAAGALTPPAQPPSPPPPASAAPLAPAASPAPKAPPQPAAPPPPRPTPQEPAPPPPPQEPMQPTAPPQESAPPPTPQQEPTSPPPPASQAPVTPQPPPPEWTSGAPLAAGPSQPIVNLQTAPATARTGTTQAPASPAAVETADGIESIRELWPAVVDLVRSGNALLGAVIEEAKPISLEDGELTVAFPPGSSFNKKKAEEPANRTSVAEAVQQLHRGRVRLSYVLSEDEIHVETDAPKGGGEEIVKRIIAEFDAEELPEGWVPEQGE